MVVGSTDARRPSSDIARVLGKSAAFPDATALCRGVAAGERENPFVSWVSAAVNVNTTKAHESTSPRLRLTPRHTTTFVDGRETRTWPFASLATHPPLSLLPGLSLSLCFSSVLTYALFVSLSLSPSSSLLLSLFLSVSFFLHLPLCTSIRSCSNLPVYRERYYVHVRREWSDSG